MLINYEIIISDDNNYSCPLYVSVKALVTAGHYW